MDMRPLYLFALCLLSTHPDSQAQVLGVIGSSTAAGGGATTFDSSWVGRTQLYYKKLGQLTTYHDIAWSGSTTWNGMPTSFVFPSGVTIPPLDTPHRADNVTRILQLGSDVVVVAYPTNDLQNGYGLTQYMSNLRIIYDSVVNVGKTCYVTTTQPRDDASPAIRQLFLKGKDSILAEFPGRALDFWTPVVDPSTLGILAQYSAGDDIHLNNAGHAVIAQVAENAGIMTPIPLPLTLAAFSARWTDQGALLQWTMANQGSSHPVPVDVQRSLDGTTFSSLYRTTVTTTTSVSSSWTDTRCPPGTSFYRLNWVEDAQVNYSRIVTVNRPGGTLSIGKVYLSGASLLVTEIEVPSAGTASISVLDFAGRLILHKDYTGLPPSATLSIPLPPLASGEYVMKVMTPDGQQTAKPFVLF